MRLRTFILRFGACVGGVPAARYGFAHAGSKVTFTYTRMLACIHTCINAYKHNSIQAQICVCMHVTQAACRMSDRETLRSRASALVAASTDKTALSQAVLLLTSHPVNTPSTNPIGSQGPSDCREFGGKRPPASGCEPWKPRTLGTDVKWAHGCCCM